MATEQKYLSVNPGALATTNVCNILKVTSGYGGITLTGAYFTGTTLGTCNMELLNYGTAGNALVSGGTIAAGASGTATVWTAGTPNALTITAAQAFVDEGEWIVLKRTDGVSGTLGNFQCLTISYVDGVVSQG